MAEYPHERRSSDVEGLSVEMLRTRDRLHAVEGKVTIIEQMLKQLLDDMREQKEEHKDSIDNWFKLIGVILVLGQIVTGYLIASGGH